MKDSILRKLTEELRNMTVEEFKEKFGELDKSYDDKDYEDDEFELILPTENIETFEGGNDNE